MLPKPITSFLNGKSINDKKDEIMKSLSTELEKSIFKNLNVFEPDYMPPVLKYRDKYVNTLLSIIAEQTMFKRNLNIFGITGCGKTLTIKYVFKEVGEMWDELKIKGRTCYISCVKRGNTSKILSTIISALGKNSPEHGWTRGTYMDVLESSVTELELDRLVVCLDEADFLIKKNLYDLIFSLSDSPKISLIFISNIPDWNSSLDTRIRSRLQLEDMEFERYSDDEVRGIMLQRIELGLKENILNGDIIDRIISRAYYNSGDLREVMKLLYLIMKEVNDRKTRIVTEGTVEACYKKMKRREIENIIDCLSPPLLLMLLVISKMGINGEENMMTVKNINRRWNQMVGSSKKEVYDPISERQTLNHLNDLKLYGLIKIEKRSFGRGKGIKNIIIPRFNIEPVYKYLISNYSSRK